MHNWQKEYYHKMLQRDRAVLFVRNEHLVGIATFFIGDDDEKFLGRQPWTVVEDDPDGKTVYIDQLITNGQTSDIIHTELTKLLNDIKAKFTRVSRVKWSRVNAEFRKHKQTQGVSNGIHTKDIK